MKQQNCVLVQAIASKTTLFVPYRQTRSKINWKLHLVRCVCMQMHPGSTSINVFYQYQNALIWTCFQLDPSGIEASINSYRCVHGFCPHGCSFQFRYAAYATENIGVKFNRLNSTLLKKNCEKFKKICKHYCLINDISNALKIWTGFSQSIFYYRHRNKMGNFEWKKHEWLE